MFIRQDSVNLWTTHKPGIPLHPVVSFYCSPTYNLLKYLVRLLSPLIGNTPSEVRNSKDFVTFVQSLCLDSNEVMLSFNVISLFTRIPVDLALRVACQCLESDNTLSDRTHLDIDEIMSLLSLCLIATYCSFRGLTYQQIHSTAMGSPVSVVIANLVMENVEERALETFSTPVNCWKRYVDDVFCIVFRTMVPSLLQQINSIERSIQFTIEYESREGCLPFLDVNLQGCGDGSISTSVYRKPTHTDKYLDFSSHHPLTHKAAVVRTLLSSSTAESTDM